MMNSCRKDISHDFDSENNNTGNMIWSKSKNIVFSFTFDLKNHLMCTKSFLICLSAHQIRAYKAECIMDLKQKRLKSWER